MAKEETSVATEVGHFRNQYYAVIVASLISLSNGILIAWATPILPLLKSDETPLASGPISLEEVSWLGSLGSIGGMTGALLLRPVTARIGCKRIMAILAFPLVVSWLLIMCATTTYPILATRFLSGVIGGGSDSGAILFVSEIADDRVRGALGSMAVLARSIGYMVAFIVGAYVEYTIVPYIYIGLPIIFLALFLCLPNTAPYLVRHKKFEEAKKSIKYYRGYTDDTIENNNAVNREFEHLMANATQQTKPNSISFREICQPTIYKALLIGVMLAFLNQYSGCYTMTIYSVVIFQQSGTLIDPHLSSIIMAALQVLGTLGTASLVDFIGRKWLLIISTVGCAIGLTTMSTYMYLHSLGFDFSVVHWIPVVSIGFVILISSLGIVPLVCVCTIEMLPAKARGFGVTVCIVSIHVFAFISSKTFPIFTEIMQLHGSIAIYAVVCAIGTVFLAVFIKETKGKNLDSIEYEIKKPIDKSTA